MVREKPLHKGRLEPMARAADCGAAILPPTPAFYHRTVAITDLIQQSSDKARGPVGVEHDLFKRWSGHGSGGEPGRLRVPHERPRT